MKKTKAEIIKEAIKELRIYMHKKGYRGDGIKWAEDLDFVKFVIEKALSIQEKEFKKKEKEVIIHLEKVIKDLEFVLEI